VITDDYPQIRLSRGVPWRGAVSARKWLAVPPEVLALADWLRSWQVTAVVMEATSY
jgi:hypothetical protein